MNCNSTYFLYKIVFYYLNFSEVLNIYFTTTEERKIILYINNYLHF